MKNADKKRIIGILTISALLIGGMTVFSCAGSAKSADAPFASSYDVVVIGAGGAGLSAAVSAKEAGANVAVFEKMGIPGGNTVRASSGINATGTSYQKAAGVEDSVDLFYSDTMKGGYNKNDPALVRNLAEKSASSVDWLVSMGADLSGVVLMAGASVKRTHQPTGGVKVGPVIVGTLDKEVEKTLGIPVFYQTRVTSVIARDGTVTGIEVTTADQKKYTINAKAVVLASGGFGANNEMVASLAPDLKGFATTNHPGATGDGIGLAEKVGAALVDMAEIQTHPTYAPGKEMIGEAVRGQGAILVNKKGARFIDELATRDVVSAAILAQDGGTSYLVFDQSVRDSQKVIDDYEKLGIVIKGDSPDALAAAIGADPATLAAAITRYNQAVAAKSDAEFGRKNMARSLSVAPYYAIEVLPAVHHTMGGVKIDVNAHVISGSGQSIPGFYAAGEVTGGVHGGNRLGGNALADIVTYGRIAGTNAAAGK
ncbi:flavocytochrome c [Spirochaetia bacterium]|nr:flavocytochrome c [Spirochaetia bacterium]